MTNERLSYLSQYQNLYWLIGRLAGGPCARLVPLTESAMDSVIKCLWAEVEANAHRLPLYQQELLQETITLLQADALDSERTKDLAVNLVALHGFAEHGIPIFCDFGKFARGVEIERSANKTTVRFLRVPLSEVGRMIGAELDALH